MTNDCAHAKFDFRGLLRQCLFLSVLDVDTFLRIGNLAALEQRPAGRIGMTCPSGYLEEKFQTKSKTLVTHQVWGLMQRISTT